ncbi:unnamed protein product, partial [Strongylus vulgaris]
MSGKNLQSISIGVPPAVFPRMMQGSNVGNPIFFQVRRDIKVSAPIQLQAQSTFIDNDVEISPCIFGVKRDSVFALSPATIGLGPYSASLLLISGVECHQHEWYRLDAAMGGEYSLHFVVLHLHLLDHDSQDPLQLGI